MPKQLMGVAVYLAFILSCTASNTVVTANANGDRTVATMCWTRDQCVVNVAEVCQEGFTIEHYFGNEMIARCVH